jgi:site-specific DNA-methyltransferase (cytosine-N4-specific)
MLERLARWKTILAPDGSLFLNLGDAWNKGEPTISLYQERILIEACGRLGWSLAQKLYWWNPARLPSPAQFVTVERVRVTNGIEQIYWLAPTSRPKANNRQVLRPYSESMKKTLRAGGSNVGKRPSGFSIAKGAFNTDNGGSIPHNLIVASNTASNDGYTTACKAAGLPVHPARFTADVPRLCVGLASEIGDVIWDPFSGSMVTAAVAQSMGRKWIANDRCREYLEGGLKRLALPKV